MNLKELLDSARELFDSADEITKVRMVNFLSQTSFHKNTHLILRISKEEVQRLLDCCILPSPFYYY